MEIYELLWFLMVKQVWMTASKMLLAYFCTLKLVAIILIYAKKIIASVLCFAQKNIEKVYLFILCFSLVRPRLTSWGN